MEYLEKGVYTKEQVAQITGINPKKQKAKRDMITWLKKNGYKVAEDRRHCIEILESPKPDNERELKLYLEKKFGYSSKEFICHLYMICNDKDYCMTPNRTRMTILKERFGVEVSEQTISGSWNKKLIESGLVHKDNFSEKKKWFSSKLNGEVYQEEVEDDDKTWGEYWHDFHVFMKEDKDTAWRKLMNKYGGCYYSCKQFLQVAWGFQDEFIDLLNKVAEEYLREAPKTEVSSNQEPAAANLPQSSSSCLTQEEQEYINYISLPEAPKDVWFNNVSWTVDARDDRLVLSPQGKVYRKRYW